jgi:hypothetical protein
LSSEALAIWKVAPDQTRLDGTDFLPLRP